MNPILYKSLQPFARAARRLMGDARFDRLKDAGRGAIAAVAPEPTALAQQAELEWANGESDAALACWKKLEQMQPQVAEWPLKIARVADIGHADPIAAERILNEAVARGIHDPAIEERLAFFRRWNRLSNTAQDDARAVVREPAATPLMVAQAVGYLLTQGELEIAREGLERLRGMPFQSSVVGSHAAALEVLQKARDEGREIVQGWLCPARDAIAIREPGADTTVITFTTIRGDSGIPVNALHALLQPAKVNALYLFDEHNTFNLGGSTTFGRPYGAMIEGLRAKLAEWNTRTLIMTGFSGPGFTALRAGLDLKADGALLFSPALTLHRRPEFAIEGARGRPGDDARMLYLEKHMRKLVPEMMTHLPDALAVRDCMKTIDVYHGQNLADLVHVYEARNVLGMEFHALENFTRHECLSEIIRRGDSDVVSRFVARVRATKN